MHTSTSLFTLSLLTSTLASPFLHPRAGASTSALLTIKTGDGDSATTLQCGLDTPCVTVFLNRNTVQTSLTESGIFCAAFVDSAATSIIQPIFDSAEPASYSSSSSGSTDSVSSDAISVGSYFCSANKASVQARSAGSATLPAAASVTTLPPAATTSATTPPATVGSSGGTSGSSSSNSGASVRIQLEQVADQFVQADIPLTAVPVPNSFQLGNQGIALSLVSATGFDISQVGCQVFSDRAGQNLIGGTATQNSDLKLSSDGFTPAMIGSIACGTIA